MKLMGNCGGLANPNSDFNDISCDLPISAGDDVDDDGGGRGEICISGGGGGRVVLVGVNLDGRSKELLAWALVKIAQSGDRVIALHVIDPNNRDRATAFSVMNNFDDSLLSSYEGLCKLKQVDLKLKVSRGTPVHKVLSQEATSSGAMSLIVGTSANCKSRRSSIFVARHCAKDVSRDTTVIAVCNGMVTFRRDSSRCSNEFLGSDGVDSPVKWRKSSSKSPSLSASSTLGTCEESGLQSSLSSGSEVNNSMVLVPANSKEILANKPGWQRVRKVLLRNGKLFNQSSFKKPSVMQRVLRLPSPQSTSAICPDQEHSAYDNENNQSSKLDTDKREEVLPQSSISVIPHSSESGVQTLPKELEGLSQKYASRFRLFSYHELLCSTSNFSPDHMIGKGGSSKVYRGIFQDGKELAVKILKPSAEASKQFATEIELLSNLDHKNIISLLGFHFKDNQVLLIYDLLSRGSLEDNLHGHKKSGNVFGWKQRYKVALGIAEALEHLHNGVADPIIHRDVKSSNILLSHDFDPKLSDFGLAMLASGSSKHIDSTGVTGTLGYLAPEYFMNGKVTDKIDVYSYGVVLLELLSGRKPIDDVYPNGLGNLVTWAKPILKEGRFRELLDPTLVDSFDHDQVEKMALAASLCTRRAPEFRPQITRIMQLLNGNTDAIEWARQQVNTLDEVDAVEGGQSASNIQSFINLAFLNLEDDSSSNSSSEQIVVVEDHLRGRSSRSSSSEQGCSADKW